MSCDSLLKPPVMANTYVANEHADAAGAQNGGVIGGHMGPECAGSVP